MTLMLTIMLIIVLIWGWISFFLAVECYKACMDDSLESMRSAGKTIYSLIEKLVAQDEIIDALKKKSQPPTLEQYRTCVFSLDN